MGATSSAISNTEVVNYNDFVIDQQVKNRIEQDCIAGTTQENILRITDSKVKGLTTNQTNILKNLCILQTMINETRDASAAQELLTKLTKEIESKGGLPGTGGYSESISELYNRLQINIDQSTLNDITKNCIMQQNQQNLIEIMNSDVEETNLAQVNQNFVNCLQGYQEVRELGADLVNKASNELDESVKSQAWDINFLASILIPIIVGFLLLRILRII